RQGRLAPVVVEQAPQLDVSDTVGICDADGFVAFQRLGRATQTATRRGIGTRLQAPNPHATGPSFTIHEVLNQLRPEPGEQQEVGEPLRQVDLDHVPENRAAADLYQWL